MKLCSYEPAGGISDLAHLFHGSWLASSSCRLPDDSLLEDCQGDRCRTRVAFFAGVAPQFVVPLTFFRVIFPGFSLIICRKRLPKSNRNGGKKASKTFTHNR